MLRETSNAKSKLVLLERTLCLCLRFVLYGVMNYSLFMPELISFYTKLNEIYKKANDCTEKA